MSDKDNATKQIFNLAERMSSAIDDAAESLDVFVLLPLTSSRPLLMSIKRNLEKKTNPKSVKKMLQSLNNVYRLEESFRVINKISTPHTSHSLKTSRGSRSSSISRQSVCGIPTTPTMLPKTPEIARSIEGLKSLCTDTRQHLEPVHKDTNFTLNVKVNIDMSDWQDQIETMNREQPISHSPYVIVNRNSIGPDTGTGKLEIGSPHINYNDANTMKALKAFIVAARSLDDFLTALKQIDKVKASPAMKSFSLSFRQALKKYCYRLQTPQEILDKEYQRIHRLEEKIIKHENEMELLKSVIEKERAKFDEKKNEYTKAINSWTDVVCENRLQLNELDSEAGNWLKTQTQSIDVQQIENIKSLELKRDHLKQAVDSLLARNKIEATKLKRRNKIKEAEIQVKIDAYDKSMNEKQREIDDVKESIRNVHEKINMYEFKWIKQNYEDERMREATETLQKKRDQDDYYWKSRENGAIALQKIYKGWRYRTYGEKDTD